MSYTRIWNESTPTDSDAASTIDDLFRNLEVDIRERLDDIVADFTADPVVPIGPGTHRVRATKTAVQSIPDNVSTVVSWDDEDYDVGDLHDKVADNERITIPADSDGTWLFGCAIRWAFDSTTGMRDVLIYKNGVLLWNDRVDPSDSGVTAQVITFPPEVVVATDYMHLQVVQNSGGALDISNISTCFWGIRVA